MHYVLSVNFKNNKIFAMKKSDTILEKEVSETIKWEPLLHSNDIDVKAHNGIVTLGGTVDNYAQKKEAAQAVKTISGVKAVVDAIKVDLFFSAVRSDQEITFTCNIMILQLTYYWKM